MADTYKLFTSDDVIVGDTSTISNPVWSGDVGTLTVMAMPTEVLAHEYYVPVYTPDVSTGTVQFAVAYGHFDGADTVGDVDVRDTDGTDTPSKTVYKQFANILLDPGVTKFNVNGSDIDSFYAISVNRSRMRQKLDPGNWEIEVSGTPYRDNSGAGENPNVNAGGRVFNVYEWDPGPPEQVTGNPVGLFYPDYGIIIFSAADVGPAPGNNALDPTDPPVYLNRDFVDDIDSFQARSEEKITSNYYFCRVNNRQFNYSSNPTFTSGSGELLWPIMVNDPQTYITTVGMYNDANELVAVAKLSKPLLKNFHTEALIKIKIDY